MLKEKIINIEGLRENSNLVLCYDGLFSDVITEKSIFKLENQLVNYLGNSTSLKKRIIYLFVEQFQNVIRHGISKDNQNEPEGRIVVEVVEKTCYITSYNYCDVNIIGRFIQYIDELNSLSINEIKTKYRFHLEENTFSEKGGAGLGLLDMRRRTKNKLVTKLFHLDNKDCIFSLKLRVDLK